MSQYINCNTNLIIKYLKKYSEENKPIILNFAFNKKVYSIKKFLDNNQIIYTFNDKYYSSLNDLFDNNIINNKKLTEVKNVVIIEAINNGVDESEAFKNNITKSFTCNINKKNIFFAAVKFATKFLIIAQVSINIFMYIICRIIEGKAEINLDIISLNLLAFIITLLIIYIFPLYDLLRVYNQERILSVNFDEEMKGKSFNINEDYFDDRWFVGVQMNRIYIFNRKYILSINNIEKVKMKSDYYYKMKVKTINNRYITLCSRKKNNYNAPVHNIYILIYNLH